MRKLFIVLLTILSQIYFPQSVSDPAVQISAVVQNNPAQITLNWIGNATTSSYQLFRKLKTALSWGGPIAIVSGTINQYVDNTVAQGTSYEYRIIRAGVNYTGYGYINAGIQVPEISNRGNLILLVDSTFIVPLNTEIKRLISDMEGDGWEVIRHDVNRNATVTHIKSLIVNDYQTDPIHIKAVFLLGHVPVPYSGNINPDGHADHLGAWPADCYYGDVDGIWTDNSVNSTTVSPARTQNVPGDGKFDQDVSPTPIELQVGRVDMAGMSTFTLSEQQLLKNYLDKDHDYRKKIYSPTKRALVADNFGYFSGEAFAASGYKNFGPLVGTASVSAAAYFPSMSSGSYQWSYGCGGGSYVSASGIGTTANFANSNLDGVFTMLFGSYFGDWDAPNSFLKAPLAQGKILTNVWSGRPHYQFHHMALGENIGYSVLLTQNNTGGLYFFSPTGISGRWVHNALMGDPTLRNDIVSPVSNVVATRIGYNCNITWSASTETNLAGYNIYMKNDTNATFVKINAAPVIGTSYVDSCLLYAGIYKYMVRALKLESGASGSYYNMSEGIADTALNTNNIASIASFTYSISGNKVTLTNTSTLSANYSWDFGNGNLSSLPNPTVSYNANGFYVITLVANHQCFSDTAAEAFNINEVGLVKNFIGANFELTPNPSQGKIMFLTEFKSITSCSVYNTEGKLVLYLDKPSSNSEIDISFLRNGIYLFQIKNNEQVINRKVVLE